MLPGASQNNGKNIPVRGSCRCKWRRIWIGCSKLRIGLWVGMMLCLFVMAVRSNMGRRLLSRWIRPILCSVRISPSGIKYLIIWLFLRLVEMQVRAFSIWELKVNWKETSSLKKCPSSVYWSLVSSKIGLMLDSDKKWLRFFRSCLSLPSNVLIWVWA